ncbi:MAG: large conductance mechanosensitive channel protein MscL [Planctomycetaceae bacterium]|nr:large conductance mechanosensitive channel protein MscL [Planctomycetaceae bacterium]
MKLLQEFKTFAMRGNVVDMAVGIIIGGAFGKIVSSLVGDVIMPALGAVTGGKTFNDMYLWLGEGAKPATLALAKESGEAYIGYGSFLQTTVDFLIVAFAIFIMIKLMNKAQELALKKEEEAPKAPPEPTEDVKLLREIRDALKSS